MASPEQDTGQLLTPPNAHGQRFLVKKNPTESTLQTHLNINTTQFSKLKNLGDASLAKFGLDSPEVTTSRQSWANKARACAADLIQTYGTEFGFPSHPDHELLETCIYEVVRGRMIAGKRCLVKLEPGLSTSALQQSTNKQQEPQQNPGTPPGANSEEQETNSQTHQTTKPHLPVLKKRPHAEIS